MPHHFYYSAAPAPLPWPAPRLGRVVAAVHPLAAAAGGRSCPPPEIVQQAQGDAGIACHLHCRNARQHVTGDGRHTPLRVDAFAQCEAECRHCHARQQWTTGAWVDQQCLNEELAHTPYEQIQAECPECYAELRGLLRGARYRCAVRNYAGYDLL